MTTPFVIVSFYTVGTSYERIVTRLIGSLRQFGIDYDINGIRPRKSWEENCSYKAELVKSMFEKHTRPIVWVDADAKVIQYPVLFDTLSAPAKNPTDLAVYYPRYKHPIGQKLTPLMSGTVFFGKTEAARRIIDRWYKLCQSEPRTWDQVHLNTAIEKTRLECEVRVVELPPTYVQIHDLMRKCGKPVIEHYQESRVTRKGINQQCR